MRIVIFLRTLLSYALLGLVAPFFLIPCLLIACLPERFRYDNRLFFFFAYWFYRTVLLLTFNSLRIEGKEYLQRKAPVIFVANHQSSLDIPAVGIVGGVKAHVWLVLEYYINTPVLGFFIRRMFVPVDRESGGKAARSLIRLIHLLKEHKRNLIIFPEGGRYTDGTVHTFYKGFAVIAKKTGFPVVPVYMPNNGKIYPPYSFLIYRYPITIIIGKPFVYEPEDTDESFTEKVYQWFTEHVEQELKK